jgi:hypothetical protein
MIYRYGMLVAQGYWEWTLFKRTDTAHRVLVVPIMGHRFTRACIRWGSVLRRRFGMG